MKKKVDDYTFINTTNLFGEDVVMVLRNRDKKHIVSIGENHVKDMMDKGYCPYDSFSIITYLKHYGYEV